MSGSSRGCVRHAGIGAGRRRVRPRRLREGTASRSTSSPSHRRRSTPRARAPRRAIGTGSSPSSVDTGRARSPRGAPRRRSLVRDRSSRRPRERPAAARRAWKRWSTSALTSSPPSIPFHAIRTAPASSKHASIGTSRQSSVIAPRRPYTRSASTSWTTAPRSGTSRSSAAHAPSFNSTSTTPAGLGTCATQRSSVESNQR